MSILCSYSEKECTQGKILAKAKVCKKIGCYKSISSLSLVALRTNISEISRKKTEKANQNKLRTYNPKLDNSFKNDSWDGIR